MLPRIKINYLSGQLGKVGVSPDGLMALVVGAVAVGQTFALGRVYTVTSLRELKEKGVTPDNNPRLYKHVEDFYRESPEGTELLLLGVPKNKTLTELCNKEEGALRELIQLTSGKVRGILVGLDTEETVNVTEGISPDVLTALTEAQALANWATESLYAPLFIILEGRNYTGESLRDLSEASYNRVGILVGDTAPSTDGACIGLLAGRIAKLPVQRNIGRVRSGALAVEQVYLGDKPLSEASSAILDLHDKGYISLRKYVGKAGFFFTDDRLASNPTDDYSHLTERRVIDKAYRIAYYTLLEQLLDEVEVTQSGTLHPVVARSIEMTLENAINRLMTGRTASFVGEPSLKFYPQTNCPAGGTPPPTSHPEREYQL